jgi:NADPH:quinone reductase-like Zn-dependent oxidoreductase
MLAAFADAPNFDDPLAALKVGEFPEPVVADGWVRVKMAAASLNWHDLWALRGMGSRWGRPEKFPIVLGCDGAGTLDDGTPVIIYPIIGNPLWKGDETLDPDREVLSERYNGTTAEYTVVPARNIVPFAKGLSFPAAALMGASWMTAYRMLFTKSDLKPGQSMLVQGSSGGVSTALIELGRAAGMEVWVAGRSEEKLALARRLGAHHTVHSGEKLPVHVDAVLDTVGEATWEHSISSVRTGGTIVTCGMSGGAVGKTDIPRLWIEQINIRGTFNGTRQELRDLVSFVTLHKLDPYVGTVLPLARAREAFEKLAGGKALGKIVLEI